MTLKRDGKIYEFFEHVILDYKMDPYVWLLSVVGRVVLTGLACLAINWVFSAR